MSIKSRLARKKKCLLALTVLAAVELASVGTSYADISDTALPEGATIHQTKVNGTFVDDATIQTNAAVMNIEQNAGVRTGLIDWQSFNIGSMATVNILQHHAGDTLINNVIGNNLSQINGKINATGNVVLVNPNGIIFDGAQINVGGFLASTAPIKITEDGDTKAIKSYQVLENSPFQGNIKIANSMIAAGYSRITTNTALALPDDFAYDLSDLTNQVRIYADGNINLYNAKIFANDYTSVTNDLSAGVESWDLGSSVSYRNGKAVLRTDMNGDDLGSLTLSGTNVITSRDTRLIYNPDLVAGEHYTDDDVRYTKKDFKHAPDVSTIRNSFQGINSSLMGANFNYNKASGLTKGSQRIGGSDISGYMLINNMAQLQDIDDQDIDDETHGNLNGNYVLGRTLDGMNDYTTYVSTDDDGNVSTDDGGKQYVQYVHKTYEKSYTDKNGNTIEAGTSVLSTDGSYYVKSANNTITRVLTNGNKYTYSADSDGNYIIEKLNDSSITGFNVKISNDGNTVTYAGTDKVFTSQNGAAPTFDGTMTVEYTTERIEQRQKKDEDGDPMFNDNDQPIMEDYTVYTPNKTKDLNCRYTMNNDGTISYEFTENLTDSELSDGETIYSGNISAGTGGTYDLTSDKAGLKSYIEPLQNLTEQVVNFPVSQMNYVKDLNSTGKAFDGSDYMHADKWDKDSDKDFYRGFNPIGDETNPFTGTLTGYIGRSSFVGAENQIHNLYINRPTETNVGLFGVLSSKIVNGKYQTKPDGTVLRRGYLEAITLQDPSITGYSNVGGLAGQMNEYSYILYGNTTNTANDGHKGETTDTRGVIRSTANDTHEAASNVGGLVGLMKDMAYINESRNRATVIGRDDHIEDGNIKNIGGIVGKIDGSDYESKLLHIFTQEKIDAMKGDENQKATLNGYRAHLSNVNNYGNVYGEHAVGGIAGMADNALFDAYASNEYPEYVISNNTPVTGHDYVGGIIGKAGSNITLNKVYNSNESSPGISNTRKDSNSVIEGTSEEIKEAIKNKSPYGAITGHSYVGGIIGGTTATSENNKLSNVYNSGNITGTGDYVGGIAGYFSGAGSYITDAYNGDNNTIIREKLPIVEGTGTGTYANVDALINHLVTDKIGSNPEEDNTKYYILKYYAEAPESQKAAIKDRITDMISYYSFYTTNTDGSKNYFYYIPATIDDDASRMGAAGIYVDANGKRVEEAAVTNIKFADRTYAVREAYRDANITGHSRVGGLVGALDNQAVIHTTYNSGSVTAETNIVGALAGRADHSTITDSFFITGKDNTTDKEFSIAKVAVGRNVDADIKDTVKGTGITTARSGADINKLLGTESAANFFDEHYDYDTKGNIIYTINYGPGYTLKLSENALKVGTPAGANLPAHTIEVVTILREKMEALGISKKDYDIYEDSVDYDQIFAIIRLKTVDEHGIPVVKTKLFGVDQLLGQDKTTPDLPAITNKEQLLDKDMGLPANAGVAISNQSDTWTVYRGQTLPLLNIFMQDASLNREFDYDGSVHNLVTDDVKGVYGRADFLYGAGKNVYTQGYEDIGENGLSSQYYLDNSNIWAPQHGLRVSPTAKVVINPIDLNITVEGEKIYGMHMLQGYYVSVPIYNTKNELVRYDYYKIGSQAGSVTEGHQAMQHDELATSFGIAAPQDSWKAAEWKEYNTQLKNAILNRHHYVVTMDGFVNSETIESSLNGLVKFVTGNSQDDFSGNHFQAAFDKQNLGVADTTLKYTETDEDGNTVTKQYYDEDSGTYDLTGKLGGVSARYNNYKVNYQGYLKVDKASLAYTYEGEKDYGADNKEGTHTWFLSGTDTNSTELSINGYLKDWDALELLRRGVITAQVSDSADNINTLDFQDLQQMGAIKVDSAGNYSFNYDPNALPENSNVNATILDENSQKVDIVDFNINSKNFTVNQRGELIMMSNADEGVTINAAYNDDGTINKYIINSNNQEQTIYVKETRAGTVLYTDYNAAAGEEGFRNPLTTGSTVTQNLLKAGSLTYDPSSGNYVIKDSAFEKVSDAVTAHNGNGVYLTTITDTDNDSTVHYYANNIAGDNVSFYTKEEGGKRVFSYSSDFSTKNRLSEDDMNQLLSFGIISESGADNYSLTIGGFTQDKTYSDIYNNSDAAIGSQLVKRYNDADKKDFTNYVVTNSTGNVISNLYSKTNVNAINLYEDEARTREIRGGEDTDMKYIVGIGSANDLYHVLTAPNGTNGDRKVSNYTLSYLGADIEINRGILENDSYNTITNILNNYSFDWRMGGNYDVISSNLHNEEYGKTNINVRDSYETIKPIQLDVTASGYRDYMHTMNKNQFTVSNGGENHVLVTDQNKGTSVTDKQNATWNYDFGTVTEIDGKETVINGLTGDDQERMETILSFANVNALTAALEGSTVTIKVDGIDTEVNRINDTTFVKRKDGVVTVYNMTLKDGNAEGQAYKGSLFDVSKLFTVNTDGGLEFGGSYYDVRYKTDKEGNTTSELDTINTVFNYENGNGILSEANKYDYLITAPKQDYTLQINPVQLDLNLSVNGHRYYGEKTEQDFTDTSKYNIVATDKNNADNGAIKVVNGIYYVYDGTATGDDKWVKLAENIALQNNIGYNTDGTTLRDDAGQKQDAGTYTNTSTDMKATYDASGNLINVISIKNESGYTDGIKGSVTTNGGNGSIVNNYVIKGLDAEYVIDKANLNYSLRGYREYGEDNSTGIYQYQLAGVNSASDDENNNGKLKSFDSSKLTLDTGNSLSAADFAGVDKADFTLAGNITADKTTNVKWKSDTEIDGYDLASVAGLSFKNADLAKNYNLVLLSDDSKFYITPVDVQLSVQGARIYGNAMKEVNGSSGFTVNSSTLTNGKYNVNAVRTTGENRWLKQVSNNAYTSYDKLTDNNFVKTWTAKDLANHYNADSGETLAEKLNAIDKGTNVSDTAINAATAVKYDSVTGDIAKYDISSGGTDKADSNVDFAKNSGNYVFANGTDNTFLIKKRSVSYTLSGSRTYGDNNSTINYSLSFQPTGANAGFAAIDLHHDSITNDDLEHILNAHLVGKNRIENTFTESSSAGSYSAGVTVAGTIGTASYTDSFYKKDGSSATVEKPTIKVNNIDGFFSELAADSTSADHSVFNDTINLKNYDLHGIHNFNIEKRGFTLITEAERLYGSNFKNATLNYDLADLAPCDNIDAIKNEFLGEKNFITEQGDSLAVLDVGTYSGNRNDLNAAGKKVFLTSSINSEKKNAFANNYKIANETYTLNVTPAPITLTITGSKTYGDGTSTAGSSYTVELTDGAMKNSETIDYSKLVIGTAALGGNADGSADNLHAGKYTGSLVYKTSTQGNESGNYLAVSNFEALSAAGRDDLDNDKVNKGFDWKNYDITIESDFTVNKRKLTYDLTGSKIYGDEASTIKWNASNVSGLADVDIASGKTAGSVSADLADKIKGAAASTVDDGFNVNDIGTKATFAGYYNAKPSAVKGTDDKYTISSSHTDKNANNQANKFNITVSDFGNLLDTANGDSIDLSNYYIVGNHTLDIAKRAINVSTNAVRTYGGTLSKDNVSYTYHDDVNHVLTHDLTANNAELKDILTTKDNTSKSLDVKWKENAGNANGIVDSYVVSKGDGSGADINKYITTTADGNHSNGVFSNYEVIQENNALKITPKNAVIEIQGTKTYGDANSSVEYYFNIAGLVNGEKIGQYLGNYGIYDETTGKFTTKGRTASDLNVKNTLSDGDKGTNGEAPEIDDSPTAPENTKTYQRDTGVYLNAGIYTSDDDPAKKLGKLDINDYEKVFAGQDAKDGTVKEGFNVNNYEFDRQYTFVVNPKILKLTISGNHTYGDTTVNGVVINDDSGTTTNGSHYIGTVTGFANNEAADASGVMTGVTINTTELTDHDEAGKNKGSYLNAGHYNTGLHINLGDTDIYNSVDKWLSGLGGAGVDFKSKNYQISTDQIYTDYTVNKAKLNINITGKKLYGEETGQSSNNTTLYGGSGAASSQYNFSIIGLKNGEIVGNKEASATATGANIDNLMLSNTATDNSASPYNTGIYLNATIERDVNGNIIKDNAYKNTISVTVDALEEADKRSGNADFLAGNYEIENISSSYSVDKRTLNVTVSADRKYGTLNPDGSNANTYTYTTDSIKGDATSPDWINFAKLTAGGVTTDSSVWNLNYGQYDSLMTSGIVNNSVVASGDYLTTVWNSQDAVDAYNALQRNYVIPTYKESLLVRKADLYLNVSGHKIYGEANGTTGNATTLYVPDNPDDIKGGNYQYAFTIDGLRQSADGSQKDTIAGLFNVSKYNDTEGKFILVDNLDDGDTDEYGTIMDDRKNLNAGTYKNDGDVNLIKIDNVASLFKAANNEDILKNYNIINTSDYLVAKRRINIGVDATREYGAEKNDDGSNKLTDVHYGVEEEDIEHSRGVMSFEKNYDAAISGGDKAPDVKDFTDSSLDAGEHYVTHEDGFYVVFDLDHENSDLGDTLRNNYVVESEDDILTVTPVNLNVQITGNKTYGGESNYTYEISGLKNNESVAVDKLEVSNTLTDGDTGKYGTGNYLDVGKYNTTSNGTDKVLVSNWYSDAVSTVDTDDEKSGFNANNYVITTEYDYTVDKADANLHIFGSKTYGDATQSTGYTMSLTGLQNGEKTVGDNWTSNVTVNTTGLTDSDDSAHNSGIYLDAGTYNDKISVDSSDIAAVEAEVAAQGSTNNGFKMSNYNITSQDSTYVVTPKDISLEIIGSKTYGDATAYTMKGYTGTFTGLVGDEAVDFTTAPDSMTVTNTATDGKDGNGVRDAYLDARTYTDTVKIADEVLNANAVNSFKTDNYNISQSSTYTVGKKDMTLITTGERTYGVAAGESAADVNKGVEYTYSAEGLLADDEQVFADTDKKTTNSTVATSNAGKYGTENGDSQVLNSTLLDKNNGVAPADSISKNYNVTEQKDDFTINKADLSVTVTGSKVYGQEYKDAVYNVDVQGLRNGETIANNNVTNNAKDKDDADHNSGIYLDVGTYGDVTKEDTAAADDKLLRLDALFDTSSTAGYNLDNYNIKSYKDQFDVSKKDVTLEFIGSKTYGEDTAYTMEEYTGTFTGLVGDEAVDFTTAPENMTVTNTAADGRDGNGDRDAYLDAGTYSDTVHIADDVLNSNAVNSFKTNNYNITQSSTYTVGKKDIALFTKGERTYGVATGESAADVNKDIEYTYSAEGLLADDEQVFANTDKNTVNSTVATSNAGKYGTENGGTQVLTSTLLDKNNGVAPADSISKNYNVKEQKDDFTINKADLSVTVTGSKVYGQEYKDAVYNIDVQGLRNGEIIANNNVTNNAKDNDDVDHNSGIYLDVGTYGNVTKEDTAAADDKLLRLDALFDTSSTAGYNLNNYNIKSYVDQFDVSKKDVTLEFIGNKTYGDDTAYTMEGYTGTFTGLVGDEAVDFTTAPDSMTVTNTATDGKDGNGVRDAYLDAGTYSDTVNIDDDVLDAKAVNSFKTDNYNISQSSTYTVDKKNMTLITKGERTYGVAAGENAADVNKGVEYTYSAEGLLTGDEDVFAKTDKKTVNSTVATSNSGKYGIENGGSQVLTSTLLDKNNGVAPADSISKNYNVAGQKDDFTINKADLSVTVTGSKVYGQEYKDAVYNIDVQGLRNGEMLADNSVTNNAKDFDDDDHNSGIYLDAGTYGNAAAEDKADADNKLLRLDALYDTSSTSGYNFNNYNVTSYKDQFDVSKKDVSLKIIGSKTYGDNTSYTMEGYTGEFTGLVGDEAVDFTAAPENMTVTNTAADGRDGNGDRDAYLDAGTYSDTVNIADDVLNANAVNSFKTSNYNISQSSTYTVGKKDMTLITTGERIYGVAAGESAADVNKGIEYIYSAEGLLTDDEQVFASTKKDTTNNTTAWDKVGDYGTENSGAQTLFTTLLDDVNDSGSISKNYSITDSKDAFRINKAPLYVLIKGEQVYGSNDAEYLVDIKGLRNGEKVNSHVVNGLYANRVDAMGNVLPLDVGTYGSIYADDTAPAGSKMLELPFLWKLSGEGKYSFDNYDLISYRNQFTVTPKPVESSPLETDHQLKFTKSRGHLAFDRSTFRDVLYLQILGTGIRINHPDDEADDADELTDD